MNILINYMCWSRSFFPDVPFASFCQIRYKICSVRPPFYSQPTLSFLICHWEANVNFQGFLGQKYYIYLVEDTLLNVAIMFFWNNMYICVSHPVTHDLFQYCICYMELCNFSSTFVGFCYLSECLCPTTFLEIYGWYMFSRWEIL